jgi:hypothetical protein
MIQLTHAAIFDQQNAVCRLCPDHRLGDAVYTSAAGDGFRNGGEGRLDERDLWGALHSPAQYNDGDEHRQ